jgi:hypothetical protein
MRDAADRRRRRDLGALAVGLSILVNRSQVFGGGGKALEPDDLVDYMAAYDPPERGA